MIGDNGNDTVEESPGADVVNGKNDYDFVSGGKGSDRVRRGAQGDL